MNEPVRGLQRKQQTVANVPVHRHALDGKRQPDGDEYRHRYISSKCCRKPPDVDRVFRSASIEEVRDEKVQTRREENWEQKVAADQPDASDEQ